MNRHLRFMFIPLLAVVLWPLLLSAADTDVPAGARAGAGQGRGKGVRATPFSIHDLNHDGVLDRDEYQRFTERLQSRRRASAPDRPRADFAPLSFEEIDADGNGRITEAELLERLDQRLRAHRRHRYQGGRW